MSFKTAFILSIIIAIILNACSDINANNKAALHYEKANSWIRINLDSALYFLDLSLKEVAEESSNPIKIKSLSLKGVAQFFKGDSKASFQSINQADSLLVFITDQTERALLQCNILIHKGVIANNSGHISQADSCYTRAISIADEHKFKEQLLLGTMNLGLIRRLQGRLSDAFVMFSDASLLCDSLQNNDLKHTLLNWISQILVEVNEDQLAISYLKKVLPYHKDVSYPGYIIEWYTNMGYAHFTASRPDSALSYYNKALELASVHDLPFYQGLAIANIGEIYYEKREVDKALPFLEKGLELFERTGNTLGVFYTMSVLSGVYFNKGQIRQGYSYLEKAEQFVGKSEIGADALLRHYKRAYEIHKRMGNDSKALNAFENYSIQKEKIADKEVKWNIASLERQLRFLEKDNIIKDQLHQIDIYRLELSQYRVRLILLISGTIMIVVLAGSVYYAKITKRKKEKAILLADMERMITSYKLKSLQSRLSPHFIFNALNSLWYLLLNNKGNEATKFLDHISTLIRFTIEKSDKHTLTIGEELKFVHNYLELENLMKRVEFSYCFKIDPSINLKSEILPMCIQTHVENAIKHGLIPLNKQGKLDIFLGQDNNNINITIEDNGPGLQAERKNNFIAGTGSGLKIQKEMIEFYNKNNKHKIELSIMNKNDQTGNCETGTRVKISIPNDFRYILN